MVVRPALDVTEPSRSARRVLVFPQKIPGLQAAIVACMDAEIRVVHGAAQWLRIRGTA